MESLNIAGIGLALAGLGLAFWLVTRLLLRTVPRIKPSTSQVEAGSADSDSSQPDAILTIQPGGRVLSLNQRARQIFNLSEKDQPDLERLARQIRPSEPFLDLCASEGQERFTLEGRQYSGSSYRLSIPQPVMVLALRPLETSGVLSDDGSTTTQTLRTITELSQAMAASLELETTVAGILESIARIIPADYLEIT
ncbi:MAG: hypothetical protein HGA53_02745, partial [Anaerolineaceae bacterium]|nr:hypothetical protein [Anaerolineaceae bacterium]